MLMHPAGVLRKIRAQWYVVSLVPRLSGPGNEFGVYIDGNVYVRE